MKTRTITIWVVLVAALLYLMVPIFWKVHKLKGQQTNLEEEIRQLSTKNQVLERELRLLKEDPVYMEYIARKKFRQAKEGEVVYKLVSPEELENP